MSGVSTGTVDRILHNRGKVSEEAQKKVEKVLKEIDYHPNLIARSLALKKNYHFITLIPSFAKGEYWDKLCEGIDKAEQELSATTWKSNVCASINTTKAVSTSSFPGSKKPTVRES